MCLELNALDIQECCIKLERHANILGIKQDETRPNRFVDALLDYSFKVTRTSKRKLIQ